ncbi:MAG: MCP four helix bundle domain-containing protein, partial [Gammaproteobacteria bacterium]|nr:MCP four helix bundle domain-containing protein [Gammaproteobacteria bacterium]
MDKLISLKKWKLSKSTLLLLASFTSILLVTFAALGIISIQIKDTQSTINEIVVLNNQKSRLLVEMQHAARERSFALYRMVSTKNSAEYNTVFKQFQNYATDFNNARKSLLAMQLSQEEIVLIRQQGELSRYALPLQNIIIKLIDKERFKEAIEILISKSIPSQNKVLSQISKVIDFQRNNNRKIITRLKDRLDKSIVLIIIISVLIFILTIITSAYVIKKIRKTEHQLFFEKELAQTTLNSIGDGVITVDKDYLIQTINPVAEILADVKKEDVIEKNILTIY